MYFQYLKALHIIFVVTWFSGLFYMVRLFVYFAETEGLEAISKGILQKQYQLMQKRLWYGIAWPSALLTLVWGTLLLIEYGAVPLWLWVKIGFVGLLLVYHGICHYYFILQRKGSIGRSSNFYRVWNEVATVLLVGIIFLVVLKSFLSLFWALLGLFIFTLLLLIAIKIYRKIRLNN